MTRPIETEERGGVRIEWFHDESGCGNPRENDNVGRIATKDRRYGLGDERVDDPKAFEAALPEGTVILPVFMYDHGGLAFNTTGFHDPWDSGQLGIIYATPEKYGAEGWRLPGDREKIEACLRAEVDEWGKWVNGEVYGYVLTDAETGNDLDSCWGFIGWDWAQEAAREAADAWAGDIAERKASEIEAERPDMYGAPA